MDLSENTVNQNNNQTIVEDNNISSIPTSNGINDTKKERSVDDFLNGTVNNSNAAIIDADVNNDYSDNSLTLKADLGRQSSLRSGSHSEIPHDLEEDEKHESEIENNFYPTNDNKISSISDSKMKNENSNHVSPRSEHVPSRNEGSIKSQRYLDDSPTDRKSNQFHVSPEHEPVGKIHTPTSNERPRKFSDPKDVIDFPIVYQKPPEYQEFTNKLTEMAQLLQRKDEEIQNLSKKLHNMESKSKSKKKSTSSSEESDKFLRDESKTKKPKKKTNKPKDKKEKKNESNSKENLSNVENVIDSSNNNMPPHEVKIKIITKEKPNDRDFAVLEKTKPKSSSVKSDEEIVDHENLAPDLRSKLDALELEVRRLQQANVDSILALQKLQETNTNFNKVSNDSLINQLLVDHSLLKEELQQMKWEHSKLTQPGLLVEEINQLKKDMNHLRKHNDFLKHYTKQSSRSLNHLTSSFDGRENDIRTQDRNHIASNIPDSNNSSNYIYQRLQSNRRPTSETPNVQKMLKHKIESLESPYHSTCQSIQYAAPFSGGPTYRARKLSDSSSALVEDVKPKTWVETVQPIYKQTYRQYPMNNQFQPSNYHRREFDEQSVDSYVSVTTSVTDRSEEDWRPNNIQNEEDNNDLLSTQESDFSDVSTVRDQNNSYQTKPRTDYSFTPKTPSDLNLEDFVKFVRPGGKMSTGRVCFIGHLPGRNEVCVGLELGEDAGKHDGLFERIRYFQCRKNRGVFISFHKIILAYKSI